MKRLLLFLLLLCVSARADEVQLDHTFGSSLLSMQSLAFSPDASKLAVAGSDGMKIYDAQTGHLLETREGNGFSTSCVAWSRDGKALAAGGITLQPGWHGELILWRADGTQRRWTTGEAVIKSLDFSPDGLLLASAAGGDAGGDRESGAVRVWNTKTGKLNRTLATFYGYDASVSFGPNGRVAFGTDGFDTTKRQVVDFASGRLLSQSDEGAGPLCWDERGELIRTPGALVAARQTRVNIERRLVISHVSLPEGSEKTVAVFVAQNAKTSKRVARLDLGDSLPCATFGGDLLALTSTQGVKVWRIAPDSRNVRPLYTLNRTAAPDQLAVSGDGKTLGIATNRGLLLLDPALHIKKLLRRISAKPLAFSSDGSQLWAGEWLDVSQSTARRLGSTGKVEVALPGVSVPSPDGQRLVQSGALRFQNGKTKALEVPAPEEDEPKATRALANVSAVNWRADGKQFVVTSTSSGGRDSDDGFFVFDQMGHFERELRVENVFASPRAAAFSPDGKCVVTLSSQEKFVSLDEGHPWAQPRFDVWDAQTWTLQKTFFAPIPRNSALKSRDLSRLVWSPDGNILAASGPFFSANRPQEQVIFFDASQGQPLGSLSLPLSLFLRNPRWAFLDSSRVIVLNGSTLEIWNWCPHKLLERQFLVPDGDKVRLVASPN